MIEGQELPVETFDMTGIKRHFFSYNAANGSWSDQATPFPPGQHGVDLPARKDAKDQQTCST